LSGQQSFLDTASRDSLGSGCFVEFTKIDPTREEAGLYMHAVVTGGAQGLGYASAQRLINSGWEVTLIDKESDILAKSAGVLDCQYFTGDVTEEEVMKEFFSSLSSLDALINNAGIWRPQHLENLSVPDQTEVLNTNVLGTLLCTKSATPLLRSSQNGSIVNFSSLAAHTNSPGLGLYAASKSAIETLTKQWAVELAPIRVNAVAPGLIITDGTKSNYEGEAGELRAKVVPLGRVGKPDDVASVVAFLVSDLARYVSGQTIYVDGGLGSGAASR